MTYRAVWIPRQHFAPECHDAATQAEAEAFAEAVVRRGEAGVVTVVEVEEGL